MKYAQLAQKILLEDRQSYEDRKMNLPYTPHLIPATIDYEAGKSKKKKKNKIHRLIFGEDHETTNE